MAEFLTGEDRRTHYCGDLRKEDIGKEVCVMGWVQRQRDLGALIFIDLRDRTGLLQLAFDRDLAAEPFDKAFSCRAEYVVVAHGVVAARGEGAVNPHLPTGEVEVRVSSLKILSAAKTPPFEVSDTKNRRTKRPCGIVILTCAVLLFRKISGCATRLPGLPANIIMKTAFWRLKRR